VSERNIRIEEFFNLSGSKKPNLCSVKFCRNEKVKGRTICHKCRMRLWRARNPMRDSFNNLRNSASKRNVSFSLSFDDFCTLCKSTGYLEGKGNFASSLHIDRKDNRKGYSADNIRVITCAENVGKGNKERRVVLPNGLIVPIVSIRYGEVDVDSEWCDDSQFAFITTRPSTDDNIPF
jgi:hypothetical protein